MTFEEFEQSKRNMAREMRFFINEMICGYTDGRGEDDELKPISKLEEEMLFDALKHLHNLRPEDFLSNI